MSGVNKKVVVLEEGDDTIEDFVFKDDNGYDKTGGIYLIKVQVQIIFGDDIEEDFSCDSEYMLNIMSKVAVVMRDFFHYITNIKLYLVMDNTGGHGTGNAINQYTQILEEKHRDNLVSAKISRNQFA